MFAVCTAAWLLAAGLPVAQGQGRPAWTLEGVLRQLDATAKDFHSLSADVERTKVTVVVNDRSTETGTILVRGDKMVLDLKAPDARTILRTGDSLYIYTPPETRRGIQSWQEPRARGPVPSARLRHGRQAT